MKRLRISIILLLALYPVILYGSDNDYTLLVNALRSDNVKGNADVAEISIIRMINHGNQAIVQALISSLSTDEHQLRQYAAKILVYYYQLQSIPVGKWDSHLYESLVAGLYSDELRENQGFGNAALFFDVIYRNPCDRFIPHLKRAIYSDDTQAQYLSSILLTRFREETERPRVSNILIQQMKNDKVRKNGKVAAYYLLKLGRENLIEILFHGDQQMDWQQCAFLQVLAAKEGIEWSPTNQGIYDEWIRHAEGEYTDYDYRWYTQLLCTIAIFVCPDRPKILEKITNISSLNLLSGLIADGSNINEISQRDQWLKKRLWRYNGSMFFSSITSRTSVSNFLGYGGYGWEYPYYKKYKRLD